LQSLITNFHPTKRAKYPNLVDIPLTLLIDFVAKEIFFVHCRHSRFYFYWHCASCVRAIYVCVCLVKGQ
jgi:hypothetical protein